MRKLYYTVLLIASTYFLAVGCQPSVRFTTVTSPKDAARLSSYQARSSSKYSNNSIKSKYSAKSKYSKRSNANALVIQKIASVDDPARDKILKEAQKWIGTPYCWGGQDKNCTDCSGFVYEIFKKSGISLPRTAARQFYYSQADNIENISPGDLVFFKKKGKITHVGIYTGKNKFIHASSSKGVMISSLNKKYYRDHFAGFGKIF